MRSNSVNFSVNSVPVQVDVYKKSDGEAGLIEALYGPDITKYVRPGLNTVTVKTTPGVCVCVSRNFIGLIIMHFNSPAIIFIYLFIYRITDSLYGWPNLTQ